MEELDAPRLQNSFQRTLSELLIGRFLRRSNDGLTVGFVEPLHLLHAIATLMGGRVLIVYSGFRRTQPCASDFTVSPYLYRMICTPQ